MVLHLLQVKLFHRCPLDRERKLPLLTSQASPRIIEAPRDIGEVS